LEWRAGFDEEIADAGRRALNPQADDSGTAAQRQQNADEPPSEPMLYGLSVNLNQVKRMIAAAEAEANKRHIADFTMVVDDTNGDLVYVQTALGARRAVLEIALEKARTAARYGVTSRSLQEKLVAGDLAQSMALPGAATMGWGGVPIVARGRIIGGVAVAGVVNANDHAISSAAAAALADDDPFASH
jgi:glc operon protein GlcG